jgi:ABC-type phosphate/phosphonate transport system substrate-binding protein
MRFSCKSNSVVMFILIQFLSGSAFSLANEPRNKIRIGTIGAIAPGAKGEAGEASLKGFVQTESQLTAEIIRQQNWQQLADQLGDKKLEVGVFQGQEFAWAKERQPSIKPLALAVHSHRYPVIYIIIAKSDSTKTFEGLRGRAVTVPEGARYLRLFVEQQAQGAGQHADAFFSKIDSSDTSEAALDDVVDGDVAAAVVDRAALDMFKRRKPARFAMLKDVSQSRPILPPIIAFADGSIDEATRKKFQTGLVNANKKVRGQSILSAFKLTGFEVPPADFDNVAKDTLQTFPKPKGDE